MLVYDILALILWANLVLTSSVSKTSTDVSSRNTRDVVSANNSRDDTVVSSTPIPSSTTHSILRNATHIIMAEGGPIYQSQRGETSSNPPTVISNGTTKSVDKIVDATATKDLAKLAKTRNASVVPRKGVIASSKITARKGVGPESSSNAETSIEGSVDGSSRASSSKTEKIEKVESIPTKIVNDPRQTTTEKVSTVKVSEHDASSNITNAAKPYVEKTSTISTIGTDNVSTIATKVVVSSSTTTRTMSSTTMSSPTTRRFKPKPTVTIGEMEVDKPIPASPTKTPPLGMPRKIDYIVPVIITIMALPLLGGMAFFMYRRGRDCWDKRHYRRMDFLIDGMYNDYSWK